jgi:hypothetical protein
LNKSLEEMCFNSPFFPCFLLICDSSLLIFQKVSSFWDFSNLLVFYYAIDTHITQITHLSHLNILIEHYNHQHNKFYNTSKPQKEIPQPLAITLHFYLIPSSHRELLCFHKFAYFGYFTKMKSYTIWTFMTGFFNLV